MHPRFSVLTLQMWSQRPAGGFVGRGGVRHEAQALVRSLRAVARGWCGCDSAGAKFGPAGLHAPGHHRGAVARDRDDRGAAGSALRLVTPPATDDDRYRALRAGVGRWKVPNRRSRGRGPDGRGSGEPEPHHASDSADGRQRDQAMDRPARVAAWRGDRRGRRICARVGVSRHAGLQAVRRKLRG